MNNDEQRREIDLMQYWDIVMKRKWVIVSFISILVVFTGIYTFTATPVYQATTTLLIEEESSKVLSIEDEFGIGRRVNDLRFFNTQINLLRSRNLAERTAEKMNLLRREEFGAGRSTRKNFFRTVKNFITLKWLSSNNEADGENTPPPVRINPYSDIARAILGSIRITPIRETKLVRLSYLSPYPNLSAELVNALAQEYINFSIEKRSGITKQRVNFLNEQIAILREELNAKNRELQRYSLEKDIVELSQSDNPAVRDYEEMHDAHNRAKFDRIRAYTTFTTLRELQGTDVDSLPHILDNPLIQQLQTDYARLKTEYEEMRKTYGENHPEMIRRRTRIDNLGLEIISELDKAITAAERKYNEELTRENRMKNELDSQMANVAKTGSAEVQYSLLKIEINSITNQIDFFVKERDEASVSINLEGLKIGNISIIDPAEVPRRPVSPNKRKNLLIAFVLGLFGGVGLCFLLEFLDNTIKGPEEVEKLTGVSSLGVIPYLPPEGVAKNSGGYFSKYSDYYSYGDESPESEAELAKIKSIELINVHHPRFFISEDYRTVRTSILLSNANVPPKTFLVTSALPSEGKTATSTNLAVAFSQLAEKVLIVDADMRKPRLHRIFGVKNIGGLSSYLTGNLSLKDAIKMSSIQNIWILPSGPIPPNPAELLNSDRMKKMLDEIGNDFDVILLDTPPVLAAIDTIVLSPLVDGSVLVIKAGNTANKAFVRAVEEMQRARAKIIGVVLNEVKIDQGKYYYKNYYRGGAYAQREE